MRTTYLLLITLTLAACGGSHDGGDVTTTDPHGTVPTMNETAGEAQPPGDMTTSAATGTFDRHDNSGFAAMKTESISPLVQPAGTPATPPSAQSTPPRPTSTQPAAPVPTATAAGH